MCQAYAAEANFVVFCEQQATLEGFSAARVGKSKESAPHLFGDAWKHGWECWHQRILPWALGKKLQDYKKRYETGEDFKRTGKLPEDLEKFLPKAA